MTSNTGLSRAVNINSRLDEFLLCRVKGARGNNDEQTLMLLCVGGGGARLDHS